MSKTKRVFLAVSDFCLGTIIGLCVFRLTIEPYQFPENRAVMVLVLAAVSLMCRAFSID